MERPRQWNSVLGTPVIRRDLNYRIVFDLSDMSGNLITNDAFVVQNTATAGFIQIVNLDLTPLPPVIFHDMHVRVETSFAGLNTGSGLFDLYHGRRCGQFGDRRQRPNSI